MNLSLLPSPSLAALTEAKQINLDTKRSKKYFHMSHASGSADGVGIQSKSEEESWTFSRDDEDDVEESDMNDDSEETESDNDGDDLTHSNLSTYKADDEEEEKEKADDDEVSSDQRVYSPPNHELTKEEENKKGNDEDMKGEQEQDEEDDLYIDVKINLERIVQQQSSPASPDLVSKFISPSPDTAISSILGIVDNYLASKMKEAVDVDSTMTTIIKERVQAQVSKIMPKIEKYSTESLGAEVLDIRIGTTTILQLHLPTVLGIIDTIKAQQIALDDGLVAPTNRLKIGKCNHRLSSTFKSNEPTLQVVTSTNKGAGVRPEVPDVPKYNSESEEESWTFSRDDEDDVEESDMNDDSEETESDNDGDDLTHSNLSTYKADDKEEEKEKADDNEVSSDQRVYSPPDHELTKEEENKKGDDEDMEGEQEQDEEDDLYIDVNINLERIVQQQSSPASPDLVSKFISPSPDTGIDSILNPNIRTHTFVNVPVSVAAETPHSDTINPQTHIPIIQSLQKTPESTTTKTIPTTTLPDIPNFVDSTMTTIIKERVQAQVSKIMPKIEKYLTESLGAEVLNLYNALVESYNFDKDIFSLYGDVFTLKRGKNDQDKDEDPFIRSKRGSKRRRSGKEAESSKELTQKESKSTSSSKNASRSQPKSSGKSAHAEEHGQKVDYLEDQSHQECNTGNDDETSIREALDDDESEWNPSSSLIPDRAWHKIKTSTVVEEGKPINAAGSGATTSAIGVMTLGAGRSTQGALSHRLIILRNLIMKPGASSFDLKHFTHVNRG
nr:hypothetical protein [Tanacetum cinerariifolium]